MLHWDRPRDNGSPITGYILRGKKVGGMFREYYKGMANSFVESSHIEGGSDYLFEVKAHNSCGKSGWSASFIVHIPLVMSETQPNLSAELKKGHFWIECYDQGAEKEFW
jgi:hypothetical protein